MNVRVLRRDRLGGLIQEYVQVAWGDKIFGTHAPGLKDAAGPRSMDRRRLGGFIQQIFSAWDEPAVQVPLELGRQIVYGAIRYARELGFEPHADFGRAAGYLGAWDGECELTFGRDGETDVQRSHS